MYTVQAINKIIIFLEGLEIKCTDTNGTITSSYISIPDFKYQRIVCMVQEHKESFIKLGVTVIFNALGSTQLWVLFTTDMDSNVRI